MTQVRTELQETGKIYHFSFAGGRGISRGKLVHEAQQGCCEAVRELHDQGLTQREIGTVVGVAASTVNHDLRPVANKTSGSQESPVQDGTEDEFVANETPAVQDAASAASASSEYQIQDPTEAPTWRDPQPVDAWPQPGEGTGWLLPAWRLGLLQQCNLHC